VYDIVDQTHFYKGVNVINIFWGKFFAGVKKLMRSENFEFFFVKQLNFLPRRVFYDFFQENVNLSRRFGGLIIAFSFSILYASELFLLIKLQLFFLL